MDSLTLLFVCPEILRSKTRCRHPAGWSPREIDEDLREMADIDEDDERFIELSTLQYTFPELAISGGDDLVGELELAVVLSKPFPVIFVDTQDEPVVDARNAQVHHIEYLPNVRIKMTLPEGYPTNSPPVLKVSTVSNWLPQTELDQLATDGHRLWEECGHDQMLYSFIDNVQDAAREAFGLLKGQQCLQLPSDLEIPLLDHDQSAKQADFDRQGHDCGICLEPKRGVACHKMIHCGHIFCRQCLKDFYNNAITEGDVHGVKCLDPGCAKARAEKMAQSGRRGKPKVTLSPSELLQIPLEHDMVKRYVEMKHKIALENDKSTVYCPRKNCEGAARSLKHKKPKVSASDLAADAESDSEYEDETADDTPKTYRRIDLLRICEDCSFAFCSRCLHTWHGEFVLCGPPRKDEEVSAEEQASLEYIKLHTTPCPDCGVPAQKTHGCNHMRCQRCETHFCYLCSAWLDARNPYQHYNTATTGCYQRLWELEGGDGDDVGHDFGGGHGRDDEANDAAVQAALEEEMLPQAVPAVPAALPILAGDGNVPGQPPVARLEAPLVLRIDGQLPARAADAPRAAAAPRMPGRLAGRFARAAARREGAAAVQGGRGGNAWPPAVRHAAQPGQRAARNGVGGGAGGGDEPAQAQAAQFQELMVALQDELGDDDAGIQHAVLQLLEELQVGGNQSQNLQPALPS